MKFLMALCVVTIHTYIVDSMEPSVIQDVLYSLIRSAVPFFFITSAYFVMKRKDDADVYKYWTRILQLYLSWSIINFVATQLLNRSLSSDSLQTAVYQIIFNGYSVLWYLWGILVVLPSLRKIRNGGGKFMDLSYHRNLCIFV